MLTGTIAVSLHKGQIPANFSEDQPENPNAETRSQMAARCPKVPQAFSPGMRKVPMDSTCGQGGSRPSIMKRSLAGEEAAT